MHLEMYEPLMDEREVNEKWKQHFDKHLNSAESKTEEKMHTSVLWTMETSPYFKQV